jgi:hypothetical protein
MNVSIPCSNPATIICLFTLSTAVFLAGCSTTGRLDDAAFPVDRELDASIVYVRGNERPEQLNRLVKPVTVVMWLNKTSDTIRIVFPERTVTIACLNPVSFYIDEQGVFESRNLPPGAVASLCFIQPGLYVYAVESRQTVRNGQTAGFQLQGTIVVK